MSWQVRSVLALMRVRVRVTGMVSVRVTVTVRVRRLYWRFEERTRWVRLTMWWHCRNVKMWLEFR